MSAPTVVVLPSDETKKAIWWAVQYRIAQLREDIGRLRAMGWPCDNKKEELVRLCDAQDLFACKVKPA